MTRPLGVVLLDVERVPLRQVVVKMLDVER
jgi:hypothetical protein